jgi:hypothetical protein
MTGGTTLRSADVVSVGEILVHRTHRQAKGTYCVVSDVGQAHSEQVEVMLSGMSESKLVDVTELRRIRGAPVLVPGPMKLMQRCLDKIDADYAGKEQWPPAASVLDLVRCTILMEDPYAMAVLIAYLRKEFRVVRVKNRFESDAVEAVSVELLQAEFYAAETLGEDAESSASGASGSWSASYDKMYRDVMLNIEFPSDKGISLICEVQVMLSGTSILKKSEQKIYSLLRMVSPRELTMTYVFTSTSTTASERHSSGGFDALAGTQMGAR